MEVKISLVVKTSQETKRETEAVNMISHKSMGNHVEASDLIIPSHLIEILQY